MRPFHGLIIAVVAIGIVAWWQQPRLMGLLGIGGGRPPAGQQAGQQGAQRPPAPVETAAVSQGRVADQVEALGSLSANESAPIVPEIAGRVVALPFREGQPVKAGAVLVELDPTIAQTELAQARANLSLAEDVIERNRTLVQRGAGTVVSLEQATAQLAIAQANLAASEARLEKLTVHAPFDGVTGLRRVSVGAVIQPGEVVATLSSLDPIKVDFGVPELFLKSVRVGQAIEVTIDAVPGRTFQGNVYAIDPVVDASTRAIRLRATIPNADGALKVGLFARVKLTTDVREDAILVPEAALIASPDGRSSAVYVVRDAKSSLTAVKIGRRANGRAEIVEGLSSGDVVVTAGQQNLRDGAAVAVAAAPASAPSNVAPPNAASSASPDAAAGSPANSAAAQGTGGAAQARQTP